MPSVCHSCRIEEQAVASASPTRGRQRWEDALMHQVQEIDVEEIMERIRERIKHRRSVSDIPAPEHEPSPFAHGQVADDFAYLHSGYDLNTVSFVSHRRVLGSLVLAAKKVIRQLIAPIVERQSAYNAASTRVVTHLKDWVEAQQQRIDMVPAEHARLRQDMVAIEPRLHADMRAAEARLHGALVAQQSALATIQADVAAQQAALSAQQAALATQ